MDYYEILEIKEDASEEVIKAAYKALAKKYHPDNCVGNTPEYEEKLKLINEAYAILSDTEKRKKYDGERIQHSKAQHSQREDSYTWTRAESKKEPESPKKHKSFWRELGKNFMSYMEKQSQEIDNAYYKGMEIRECVLIQTFKSAKGAERWGYARAMEQRGLLTKDKDGKYIPTSKYHYYS